MPARLAKIHEEALALSAEKKHDFELNIEKNLLLQGNQSELYSAFSNLVFNALRYTPAGGEIKIRWYSHPTGYPESEEQQAHMEVSDSGIPPQHISRLTERFYRVEQSRSRDQGGSGLGLSIVKHVLARHQAGLHIERPLEKVVSFAVISRTSSSSENLQSGSND